MRTHNLNLAVIGILACLGVIHGTMVLPTAAQGPQDWGVASGDWNVAGNWSPNKLVPDANFSETALINNGGTAILTGAASFPVGGVAVGPGSLELTSSGSLSVVENTSQDPSAIGFFDLSENGTLTLADTASVTVEGEVNLNGTTYVTGKNASLSTQGNLSFGSNSLYNATISDSASHSVFSADGIVTLEGTLNVIFTGGVTPSSGDTWTLFDAATIDGSFSKIEAPAGLLGLGQVMGIAKTAGGKGTLGKLGIQQRLVLKVNRQTGTTTLLNPGSDPISIEGYTFQSTVGALASDNGNWNSLQDQAVPNWAEVPSTSHALGELENSSGGNLTIASSGGQQALGAAFSPLLPFGSPDPEDLVFKYRDATEGTLIGVVEYVETFAASNLVLTVDPTSGNAQVRNASPSISVDLQGYSITSLNGSLLASFDSDLPDAQWNEIVGTANGIGELNSSSGSTTLAPGATFDLTGAFSPGGSEDLVFKFRHQVDGESEADFNGDGQIDGDDLTGSPQSWDARFGTDLTGSDFLAWQRLNGTAASSGGETVLGIVRYDGSFAAVAITAAIPEPTSAALALVGVLAIGGWTRRSNELHRS